MHINEYYFSLGTHLLSDKMADPTLAVTSCIIKNPSPTALIFTSGLALVMQVCMACKVYKKKKKKLSTCRHELQFMDIDCRLTIFHV